VVVARAVEMAPAMAVEMAAAVVGVVVVAIQGTPSIRLILKNNVANALSRLVKQFFDSLYFGVVKVVIVREDSTSE
jgi:Na+/glutamate symporter